MNVNTPNSDINSKDALHVIGHHIFQFYLKSNVLILILF